jgi:hypothetical protein
MKRVRQLMVLIGIGVLWWAASIPWGLPPWHLIPFVAPGALIGMGLGWAFHAGRPLLWTWRTATRWGLSGGVVIAPLITLYIPLQGDLHPDRMLASFVWLAWTPMILGAIVAFARSGIGGARTRARE